MTDFQLKKILEMIYKIAVLEKLKGGTIDDLVNVLADLAEVEPEKVSKSTEKLS